MTILSKPHHDLKTMEVVFVYPYSSFDTLEMPKEAREFIYNLLNRYENVLYVAFQSRAEFVTDAILTEVKEKLAEKKSSEPTYSSELKNLG